MHLASLSPVLPRSAPVPTSSLPISGGRWRFGPNEGRSPISRFVAALAFLLVCPPASAQIVEQPLGWEALYDGVNSYPIIAGLQWPIDEHEVLAVQVDGEIVLFRLDKNYNGDIFVDEYASGVLAAEIVTERCLENSGTGGVCTPVAVAPPMFVLLSSGPTSESELSSYFWEASGTTYGLTTVPFSTVAVDRSGPVPVARPTLGMFTTYANPIDTTTHARLLDPMIQKRIITEGPYTGTVPEPGMVYALPIGAAFLAGIAGLAFARRGE